jgi:glycosyltransferase involved in cell wall biosynthesis
MTPLSPRKVGYVLKRYPRYSETFVVNEILAHEAAGFALEIFSLRPPEDTHFQDLIARVRAPVNYLRTETVKLADFWRSLGEAAAEFPGMFAALREGLRENVIEMYQSVLLARAVQRKGVGHLHAHFATSAASVARLASLIAGVPYSVTAHAKDIFHEEVRPDDLMRKFGDAAAVVTVSDFNLEYLRQNYGPAAARVRRIYNGLDLDKFSYQTPSERPPLILAVGRLVEKKGFADLIDACAILAQRGTPFTCQIVGTGELEMSLREKVLALGLTKRVQLLGPRPQDELVDYIRRAAVFAAPSVVGSDGNRDGLPTVLLEAMALGTPCVSTTVTGIPEAVRDGETGLLVPEHDPAALADSMERLLVDADLRTRLAAKARQLIEAEFDLHRNAAQLRQIFNRAEPEKT